MALTCCSKQHKPDGIYYISHPEKGTTKIFYAKCHKCKGLVLNLYYGLFANKSELLTGKNAKEFTRKYPNQVLTESDKEQIENEAIANNSNPVIDISGSWVFGGSTEDKDGNPVHKSYYFNSGRLRRREIFETVLKAV